MLYANNKLDKSDEVLELMGVAKKVMKQENKVVAGLQKETPNHPTEKSKLYLKLNKHDHVNY